MGASCEGLAAHFGGMLWLLKTQGPVNRFQICFAEVEAYIFWLHSGVRAVGAVMRAGGG